MIFNYELNKTFHVKLIDRCQFIIVRVQHSRVAGGVRGVAGCSRYMKCSRCLIHAIYSLNASGIPIADIGIYLTVNVVHQLGKHAILEHAK